MFSERGATVKSKSEVHVQTQTVESCEVQMQVDNDSMIQFNDLTSQSLNWNFEWQ